MDLSTWLQMGGYGAYVWPTYGLAFAILAFLTIGAVRRWQRAQRRLGELQRLRGRAGDTL